MGGAVLSASSAEIASNEDLKLAHLAVSTWTLRTKPDLHQILANKKGTDITAS